MRTCEKASKPNLIHILLVDDSPADQLVVERAFEDAKVACKLSVVENGEKALALLNQEKADQKAMPDLVLLDINMPIMNGHDTLQSIRAHPNLSKLPVIMFTTSDSEKDIDNSYAKGANAYIKKPASKKGFIDAILTLDSFWFNLVSLPSRLK